jgi:tRNA uridine 5-carboxymethylaminomethyl modification enzyme
MFCGRIDGVGPRYCPSIEDKINRFADRDRHQIFVEPEGFNTIEVYVNGFSTSLPEEVQYEALRKMPWFRICQDVSPRVCDRIRLLSANAVEILTRDKAYF